MRNVSPQALERWSGLAAGLTCLVIVSAPGAVHAQLEVRPSQIVLQGNFARAQLIVGTAPPAEGELSPEDLTRLAEFESADATIAVIDPQGRVLAKGNGQTEIRVKAGGQEAVVPILVSAVTDPPQVSYSGHVAPVISKAGCNAGACHASQYGKGGFVLSVFGFDPDRDHSFMVRDRQGRRVDLIDPSRSLILLKPTQAIPHGGGKRLEAEAPDYQILSAWIQAGAPGPSVEAAMVVGLSVEPAQWRGPVGRSQQLAVTASYSDGSLRDVTHWTRFDTLDDGVAHVTADGLVTSVGTGQAPIMVRFEGQAALANFVVPTGLKVDVTEWLAGSKIDQLAGRTFAELGIPPSPLSDDATYFRRVWLDALGTLPDVEATTAFLESMEPDKRQKLVESILGLSPGGGSDVHADEYAAWWALKWSDLIRSSSDNLGEQGLWAMYNWIRESFRINKPFDAFARELVTAKGSVYSNGPANYFRIANNPADLGESTAQLFLGIRLQCAKCHHHPFEKYGQSDYYGFAAFFSRVGTKGSQEFGLFGGEQVVVVRPSGEVTHPRTGKVVPPTPLEAAPVDDPLDRRMALAAWMTSKDNKYFARNVVNRLMAYLLGRGLVDPVDDLRATNPPSNGPLLDYLADQFVASGYDVKRLMAEIMASRLYQLDSQPLPENAADGRFYSHFRVKRLAAEALLDAIDKATGAPTKFPNLPLGTRAIELPDSDYPSNYFLVTFGKPRRVSVCECERMPDENLAQALHTLNGDMLAQKIAGSGGRVARLVSSGARAEDVITELYLASLSRRPTGDELTASKELVAASPTPKEGYEDLFWALLNSKQFLFNH
jgi:hypothetical protein